MSLRDILVKFGVQVDQTPLLQLQQNANKAVIRFAQLRRIAGFALAALGAGAIADSADQLINYQNRIRAVTDSLEEYKEVEEGIIDVSRRSLAAVDDTAAVYQRYRLVTKHLGMTQGEVLDFTETLTKAMKLGGSSAAEARGALIQLGQGIGNDFKSGGQELNSIIEQAPKLAQILAKAAGGTVGNLKDLARAGKLSGKVVVQAMKDATAQINADFETRQKSFEDIATLLKTEWLVLLKQFMPVISKLVDALLRGVRWFRAWVENGEAFNSVVAASTVVVIALTAAFGSLAVSILAAAAPFIALFALIEDFVALMRGQKSVIGYALFGDDEDKIAVFRDDVNLLWEYLKGFFGFLKDPSNLGSTFKMLFKEITEWLDKTIDSVLDSVDELGMKVRAAIRGALGETVSDMLGIGKADESRKDKMRKEVRLEQRADEFNENERRQAAVRWNNSGFPALDKATTAFATPMSTPEQNVAMQRTTKKEVDLLQANPLAITNNITVQGNADASTAREIARETGKKTAASLGRDRSAIGAAVGAQ